MKKKLLGILGALLISAAVSVPSFAESNQYVLGMLVNSGNSKLECTKIYDERMGREVYVAGHFRVDSEKQIKVQGDRLAKVDVDKYFIVASIY